MPILPILCVCENLKLTSYISSSEVTTVRPNSPPPTVVTSVPRPPQSVLARSLCFTEAVPGPVNTSPFDPCLFSFLLEFNPDDT